MKRSDDTPDPHAASRTQGSRWRRVARRFVVASCVVAALLVAMVFVRPAWAEVVANAIRAVLGPAVVARLEDVVYGARDRVLLGVRGRGAPRTYWVAPSVDAPETALPVEAPPRATPPFPEVAAPRDGEWTVIHDDVAPAAPMMWKTTIHPDPRRGRAAVAVLAIRAADARLHLFAGTEEPDVRGVPRRERPGLVPASLHPQLVAVFSGGFRSINGRYAMRVGDRVYHRPHRGHCTLGIFSDGHVEVADWAELAARESSMVAYRQSPPCLLAHGALGRGVDEDDEVHIWGVSVQGTTVIRRSGFGVSADGRTWYYAIGDELTTQALALAFRAVGAESAIPLDVNEAPTRLLFYRHDVTPPLGTSFIPGSMVKEGMYITRPWERDFFALTRAL